MKISVSFSFFSWLSCSRSWWHIWKVSIWGWPEQWRGPPLWWISRIWTSLWTPRRRRRRATCHQWGKQHGTIISSTILWPPRSEELYIYSQLICVKDRCPWPNVGWGWYQTKTKRVHPRQRTTVWHKPDPGVVRVMSAGGSPAKSESVRKKKTLTFLFIYWMLGSIKVMNSTNLEGKQM